MTAQLTESHLRLVKEVYPLSGLPYLSEYEKLAYLLGREHSYRERVSCIQALAARFERVAVYGNPVGDTHAELLRIRRTLPSDATPVSTQQDQPESGAQFRRVGAPHAGV